MTYRKRTTREILTAIGKETQGKRTDILSNLDKMLESHNTQKKVADSLGWSTGKTARAQYVWDHADEETKEEVKSGER